MAKDVKKNKNIIIILAVSIVIAILFLLFIIILILLGKGKSLGLFSGCTIEINDKIRNHYIKKYNHRHELIHPRIFVAISSYRDPELCMTLEDLFDKAIFPHRIYIGI